MCIPRPFEGVELPPPAGVAVGLGDCEAEGVALPSVIEEVEGLTMSEEAEEVAEGVGMSGEVEGSG